MRPLGFILVAIVPPVAAFAQQPRGDASTEREIRRQSER
jgi:hypothetical protein